ncbi:glutathione S-transferase family protein [Flagellatimonas centrodinii]|uniref:glutathione S-transferase family protein n=1 Tax=Flagellatimonas centrodinii TaxID=2806210 RepID=UPI001FF83AAC|nr:glutathione S-transferase family protein [Flagellatimonas centrodinii]ULQ46172.1 glutathione S-transferase family protein [Flagellatimonas centrodinii]
MKLYCNLTSPFARKVRVVVRELGLADRVEEELIDPFAAQLPTEFLAANPLSRIPTLVTDRGEALPDSKLIIDYLQRRSKARLSTPDNRWAAARRGVVAEGILEAALASVLEKRRPESIVYPAYLDRQQAAILRAVDMLELEASGLTLEQPGVVDITTGVALAYLDFRLPYIPWRKRAPALVTWFTPFAERPSMQATCPPA